ncbi:hypothetical protein K9N68_39850 (plasmid) [Kovacikia minuta CCNUW1]|uniref:hypothetical protein n=1 Tax=Kovacikia minuta TaxID=2931930 RepID=UPI001CC9D180|nr:hypothetical protein [Kovacikia minuta]UBF30752.1 hypothetical protein K9N68_39850 [Kovacikia minuta CCNUW1]
MIGDALPLADGPAIVSERQYKTDPPPEMGYAYFGGTCRMNGAEPLNQPPTTRTDCED